MEVLIQTQAKINRGQDGAFFSSDIDGFNMHFSTFSNVAGERIENWHSMQFRTDFIETLKKYGRLPMSSYEA